MPWDSVVDKVLAIERLHLLIIEITLHFTFLNFNFKLS